MASESSLRSRPRTCEHFTRKFAFPMLASYTTLRATVKKIARTHRTNNPSSSPPPFSSSTLFPSSPPLSTPSLGSIPLCLPSLRDQKLKRVIASEFASSFWNFQPLNVSLFHSHYWWNSLDFLYPLDKKDGRRRSG